MDKEITPTKVPFRARYLFLAGIGVVGVGVVFYHIVEKLSYVDSLYFSVITLTTIGYGDIVPKTDAGKLFTTAYVLVGIGILAAVVNLLLKKTAAERLSKRVEKNNQKDD